MAWPFGDIDALEEVLALQDLKHRAAERVEKYDHWIIGSADDFVEDLPVEELFILAHASVPAVVAFVRGLRRPYTDGWRAHDVARRLSKFYVPPLSDSSRENLFQRLLLKAGTLDGMFWDSHYDWRQSKRVEKSIPAREFLEWLDEKEVDFLLESTAPELAFRFGKWKAYFVAGTSLGVRTDHRVRLQKKKVTGAPACTGLPNTLF